MDKFRGQIQIGFRYREHLGPRSDAAGVCLRLETHDRYEFVSAAQWCVQTKKEAGRVASRL
jgi:hypothetical protein